MKLNYKINLGLTAIFILIGLSFFFGSSPASFFNQSLFLIFPALSAIAAFLVFKKYGLKSESGQAWLWLAFGLLFWFLAEAIWYAYKYLLGIDPFVSLADLSYLLAYPCLLVGFYKEYKLAKLDTKGNKQNPWLGSFAMAFLALFVLYFGVYKAYEPTLDLVKNFFIVIYGVADLFLVVGCLLMVRVSLAYQGGKFFNFWVLFTRGFFVYLIADILYAIYNRQYANELQPYIFIDMVWTFSYFIFTIAMVNNYVQLRSLKDRIQRVIAAAK
jgi:hypothetical protein